MRLCEGDLPTICSVCRQPPSTYLEGQVPEYVNMESAYDGPVVRISDNIPPVYVENIVVCEDCVKAAAGLLGMEDTGPLSEHVSGLEAYTDQLEAEVKEKDATISDMGHTIGTLLDKPVKRPGRRPQLKGPASHDKEMKELRSARTKAERARKKVASGADGN